MKNRYNSVKSELKKMQHNKISSKKTIKLVYVMTACKKLGPVQQTLNIIKHMDSEIFETILITLYEEPEDSIFANYLPYVSAHHFVKTDKKAILLGYDSNLRNMLENLQPDIIHTVGVFPDYAVSKMHKYKQILTLRNYVYDDYPAKFGTLRGLFLAKLQRYAMKHASKVVTCSESLAQIYKEKLHLSYEYIRNGVDVAMYTYATMAEKKEMRLKYTISQNTYVFVYSGQFIERKNLPFLLESYIEQFGKSREVYLLLLGNGSEFNALQEKYKDYENIDFRGSVSDVASYLKACDCYVSTSKSEGLPNGVIEAMATGLPVILSDIEQHKELFSPNTEIGYLYTQNNKESLKECMKYMADRKHSAFGENAYKSVQDNFNALKMSQYYQCIYQKLAKAEGGSNDFYATKS